METEIVALDSEEEIRGSLFGDKAASLSLLRRAGLDVPKGVAISHASMNTFLGAPEVRRRGRGIGGNNSCRSRRELRSEFQKQLLHILAGLGLGPSDELIVRSSSVGEDSDQVSFAGIFASLRVPLRGDQLIRAIQTVRASRFSPTAQAYVAALAARGLLPDSSVPEMSVVVQLYVRGKMGGVVFTVDPVDGGEGLVEASLFGAENVVSGGAEVHSGRLGPRSGIRGHQFVTWASSVLGGRTGYERFAANLLSAVRLICKVQSHMVDIEWVWDGDKLWIVQSRPLTAGRRHAHH